MSQEERSRTHSDGSVPTQEWMEGFTEVDDDEPLPF